MTNIIKNLTKQNRELEQVVLTRGKTITSLRKTIRSLRRELKASDDTCEELTKELEEMPDCDNCEDRMPDEPMRNEGYD
jgi:predicted RNase H-like nuclease (RuvC/YqgF family)